MFSQLAFCPYCSLCGTGNLHTLKQLAFLAGNASQGILWHGRNQASTKEPQKRLKKILKRSLCIVKHVKMPIP